MEDLPIDMEYLLELLYRLLITPSPTGLTDRVVEMVCQELDQLEIPYGLTRRGAIRAVLPGLCEVPNRAIVAHLDTLGCQVLSLKDNGRLGLVPVGFWSARFAEGARVTVHTSLGGAHTLRGTILPLKASGHVFGPEVDTQPVSWDNLELRLDAEVYTREALQTQLGLHVGDHVSVDSAPEFVPNGFLNARHLDDKAGCAALLAAAKAIKESRVVLPMEVYLLFTISEEVGVGASHILHGNAGELLSVDNGAMAPGQNTCPMGVTVAMADSTGPFDWHLTRQILGICQEFQLNHSRDIFRHYRSDAAAAVEAGNDLRTALICFALDASHGWERTHRDSLETMARLLALYMQSPPTRAL
ncbi:MAG: osmoprotectant NAGGN system M42 family peptidase [Magnetococcales bacterium]|nr:osmoprotectant NAGGN system M42 family peptidase [Magnetococcales bacterium]